MDVYHFAYRSALLARGSFKIGGNTVRFSASLIHNHFASRLATTLSSAVAASCSSLHISDEVAQVVSSSETCRHPTGAPQLLGLVTIEHLWRFVYDFQVYPSQCASDATGTFPTHHQQQARTISRVLHGSVYVWQQLAEVIMQCRKTVLHFKLHHNEEWKTAGLLGHIHIDGPHSITTKWKIPMANTTLGSQQQADCCCWVREALCK